MCVRGFLDCDANNHSLEEIQTILIKMILFKRLKFVHSFIGRGRKYGNIFYCINWTTIFCMIKVIQASDVKNVLYLFLMNLLVLQVGGHNFKRRILDTFLFVKRVRDILW